jgi:hypothetical protein
MSYTTVKIIESDGKITDIAELSNSWGSAAFVWSALAKRYLDGEVAFFRDRGKQIWALVNDVRLSHVERIVLASTFDHAIIEQAHFADAASAFREFSYNHGVTGNANHLPTIARLLYERKDYACTGMCFHQTSVSEDPWAVYDAEAEEYEPYDMVRGDKHFFVFAEYGNPPAPPLPAQL